jgi:DNA mismatch endonuclease (patch repair protein)
MAAVRGKNTKPELIVRRLLHALGYRYRLHVKDLPGRPDIVFRKRRCVIFVNGCFWHQHSNCPASHLPTSRAEFWKRKLEGNKLRDQRIRKELRLAGWNVLTLWECELKNINKLERQVMKFLGHNS